MELVERRRQLHRWPEVGFTEFWTAWTVLTELTGLGYDVRWGTDVNDVNAVLGLPAELELAAAERRAVERGADPAATAAMRQGATGIVADLVGTGPGPTTALRFDMDALPVDEETGDRHRPARDGFRSEVPGQMHACGHDGHVAIGLELARRLADRDFPGRVRLLFQAAEEGGRGAAPLIAGGALTGVDRLVCLHLGLNLPVDAMAGGGIGFFANAKYRVELTGRAAHAAAAPEAGRNALLGAATALLGIHALPRFSGAATRINVGLLRGGTAPNIIPAQAELAFESRATEGAVNEELVRRALNIVDHAAAMYELGLVVEEIGRATTATCDADLVDDVVAAASAGGDYATVLRQHEVGVSDDATLMMRAVQEAGGVATYAVAGASSPGPHHSSLFDIDEQALGPATSLLERLVRQPRATVTPHQGGPVASSA